MGFIEEVAKNKEELILKFLSIIEGKETKARVNLDGVSFKVAGTEVRLDGDVEFTVMPFQDRKKKK